MALGNPLRVGDQVKASPRAFTQFANGRLRGVVIDLGDDGVDPFVSVRWMDGAVTQVAADELELQETTMKPRARTLVEAVLQGVPVRRALEPGGVPLIEQDVHALSGEHPSANVPPNAEDPSFEYKTSHDGPNPHEHTVCLGPDGNGTTDEALGSQHEVCRWVVQPDPTDGHTHELDQSTRRDVPTSTNYAGQPESFHSLSDDPQRWSY